ncbi:MAG: signal peptidase I [Phenylobacterium sp.]|uniref:signal peptidase I n=1 Tax=Phenylobacterium sp. TaxID=1871053 RepID=UPI001A3FE51C|nr:signal peptidase I [Phenylobacterium sp.]MBL8773774.1 signal peptidase I [Phenylobacterium sp.]
MNDTPDTKARPAKSFATEVVETVKTLVYALLIALVLRVILFEPFTIPSASMEPGLLVGDYVVATKWDYGWSRHSVPFSPPLPSGRILAKPPARGDVVVFKLPRDPSQTYVKRLIGLPGDRIEVQQGAIIVNGQPIVRTPIGEALDLDAGFPVEQVRERLPDGKSYLTFERGSGHDGDDRAMIIVPEGHYFMVGDNRDNSLDSRWPEATGVGLVPADNLIGRARIVLVSWPGGANIFNPITWVAKLDLRRALKPIE